MIQLSYDEKCYAKIQGQCVVLTETNCTNCPFYKPVGCEDWVKVNEHGTTYLLDPEEYDYRRKRK